MIRIGVLCAVLLPAVAMRGGSADDATAGIAWRTNLPQALEEAKTSKRPVFVAINAVVVDDGKVESASKLLREQAISLSQQDSLTFEQAAKSQLALLVQAEVEISKLTLIRFS